MLRIDNSRLIIAVVC